MHGDSANLFRDQWDVSEHTEAHCQLLGVVNDNDNTMIMVILMMMIIKIIMIIIVNNK